MNMNLPRLLVTLALGMLLAVSCGIADEAPNPLSRFELRASQKELLTHEPILVTVVLEDRRVPTVPIAVDVKEGLRFEIQPAVKPRPNAKPLPGEAATKSMPVKQRVYDLLEWYQFPAEGSFTVHAVYEDKDGPRKTTTSSFSIRRPAKDDGESAAVARLHHLPWSNYVTDAFCGDTFDVVKRWPQSKLAKYCHYWNGLHLQHKKEYDKASASFKTVVERYPDFVLAHAAEFGVIECLYAQKKLKEAAALAQILGNKARGPATVFALNASMVQRIHRDLKLLDTLPKD